jgi:hypothetical protein
VPVTIGPSEYEQVRKALGTDVSVAVLPDATLTLPIYLDAANEWANAQFTDASTLSAGDQAKLKRAASYYLAALVAPALPSVIRAGDLGGLYEQREPVDREKQATFLFARADATLNDIVGALPVTAAPLPTLFITAPGTRGR